RKKETWSPSSKGLQSTKIVLTGFGVHDLSNGPYRNIETQAQCIITQALLMGIHSKLLHPKVFLNF
ncbi:hypothetical protein Csa_023784, partial [Cucumis sativus]